MGLIHENNGKSRAIASIKRKVCMIFYLRLFKGTHARDFHSLFLNFFCIFQSLIDTKRSQANIFENILQIRTDIRSFRSLTVFAESAKHS
jgi:hypothetical protein